MKMFAILSFLALSNVANAYDISNLINDAGSGSKCVDVTDKIQADCNTKAAAVVSVLDKANKVITIKNTCSLYGYSYVAQICFY